MDEMRGGNALDVGCDTGRRLHRARGAGHPGELVGIEPDPGMLEVSSRYAVIEWRRAKAAEITDRAIFLLLDVEALNARLEAPGFVVKAQCGHFDGTLFTPDAAEIVTVAIRTV